ncbi:MAG: FAD:protein transferase, partial [Thermoleophilaceae bacterium]|nr:FAD:protein transferase [Thermoleophilaceae bacterium]
LAALGSNALLWTTDDATLPEAATELLRELDAVDSACSRFRDDSELARLNRAGGKPFAASRYLFEAVRLALRAAASTGGLVDPTIGRALRLAGYDRPFTLVRERDAGTTRARFAPAAGWQLVELDEDRRSIRIPAGVELDLGATAKALAADRVASAAAARTGAGILVSLGGDIAVAGPSPLGGWPVRIAEDHRASLDSPGPVVSLQVGGLATSSVSVRRWRAGERELHHILDPRNGRPASSCWRTVTVAAASCVDANIASTAAVLLSEAAPRWLMERRLPARLVDASGGVVCIGDWPAEAELAA